MREFTPGAPPTQLIGHLLAEFPEALFSDSIYQSTQLIERYGIDWALRITEELALEPLLRKGIGSREILARRSYIEGFFPALEWTLERLVDAGYLKFDPTEKKFFCDRPLPPHELGSLRRIGLQIDGENRRFLDLLDLAGSRYRDVALGEVTGEAVLASPTSLRLWLDYFHNDNPVYALNNRLAAWASCNRLARLGRPLRILEVGGGAGSAAQALITALQSTPNVVLDSYVFTEPQAFLRRQAGRALTQGYPDVDFEFAPLDIDKPWREQFPEAFSRPFDAVIGVNVFHVAKDLLFALEEARSALASNGWLLLGECIRPFPDQRLSSEMLFQLLESFTSVELDAECRPRHGFLSPEEWLSAASRSGFAAVEMAPDLRDIRQYDRNFQTASICATGSV